MEQQPQKRWWRFGTGETFGWPTVFAIAAIAFVIWLNVFGSRSYLRRHINRQTELPQSDRLLGR
jgi:hypothetical protein